MIYGIVDPRNGHVRYIGKTGSGNRRWWDHLYLLRAGKHSNLHLQRWFKTLDGAKPKFTVLQECLPGMMNAAEQEWIAKGRARGWKLCNFDEGGTGGPKSPEMRRRLSELAKAKWCDPVYRAKCLANPGARRQISDEERERRSELKKRNRAINARNMEIAAQRRTDRDSFKTLTLLTNKGTAFVPLTKGKRALIDASDADRVKQQIWFANAHRKGWRARRQLTSKKTQSLPQFIMNASPDETVRHRNRNNQLDCRRANLSLRPSCLSAATYGGMP